MKNHVGFARCCVRATLFLLISTLAFSQGDLGSISGYVKDPSGALIPNAKITIHNSTGLERQATTNDSGYYTITNIPASTYTVTVEAAGFKKYESTEQQAGP